MSADGSNLFVSEAHKRQEATGQLLLRLPEPVPIAGRDWHWFVATPTPDGSWAFTGYKSSRPPPSRGQTSLWEPAHVPIAGSRREHATWLLKTNRDLWLATSSADGGPHLVPLSFVWHGEQLLFATSATSQTGLNLLANGLARAAVGGTRDLVIVVGAVSPADAEDQELSRVFVERLGFDPTDVGADGTLYCLRPHVIQAWIERADNDRWLMREGLWLS